MRPSIAIDWNAKAESSQASAVREFLRRHRRGIDNLLEIASLAVGVTATREVLMALIGASSGLT